MEISIREQAARWVTELGDGNPATRARFAEWLRESPRHVEEFLFLDAMWQEFGRVDAGRRIDVDGIIEAAKQSAERGTVVSMREAGSAEKSPLTPALAPLKGWRGEKKLRWVAAAASLSVGLAIWLWAMPPLPGAQTYATALGEQRAVKLPDDSFVYLNTGSRIKVDFDAQVRAIRLLEGEALFEVERDAARPFRVQAGAALIEAVGTQFNVYRRDTGTTVSVIEGSVRVSRDAERKAVAAGEQASIALNGTVAVRPEPEMEQTIAWRERRLVFRADPLEEVAAQFNRYNTLKIRVEGEAVRERKLIGTFDADDPESLAQFLAQEKNLLVERGDTELVIRAR